MYRERDASLTQMSIIDNGHTGKTVEHRLAAERFTRTSFRTDCVQRNRQSGKFPLKIDGKTHEEHKGKSKLTKDMKTPTQHVRLDRLKLIPDAQQFWTWIHWDSHNRLCWTDWLRTKKLICRSDQLNKRSLVRILLWAKACDNFFGSENCAKIMKRPGHDMAALLTDAFEMHAEWHAMHLAQSWA